MQADPNVPEAAFAEYAADRHWLASHLAQLLGAWALVGSVVLAARRLQHSSAARWASMGEAAGIATIAATGALQAVDGVALKAMVNAWAAAPEAQKAAYFAATLGVRQIEIGLAAIASLLVALTAGLVGMALLVHADLPKWIGLLGLAAGALSAASALALAYTGFSALTMSINMPAALLLMAWAIALGALSERHSTTE